MSRLRNRKSCCQFRFVCFKWTSSLAEDIVKRLLIQLSQNEQLSGEVEFGNLNPVAFSITTQMPLKFFVHYCFKWTMKVFLWTTLSICVVSKIERPFFLFAHQSTTWRWSRGNFFLYKCAYFQSKNKFIRLVETEKVLYTLFVEV